MGRVVMVTSFIDGTARPSSGDEMLRVVNPATGQPRYDFQSASLEDVDAAVAAARRAFGQVWRKSPPSFRKQVLLRFADLILRDAAILDRLDAEDMGKPISTPIAGGAVASTLMRFFAEAVDKVSGHVYESDQHSLVLQRRVPRGVIGAVTPWNFPTMNALRKLAPSLAAGNAIVLKPSEWAPRSALHLAGLAIEAGIPAGVFNIVMGSGATVGRAIATHMDVDMLTFTGSTAVGMAMMQYSGQSNLKEVMAECGGKSPQIVFDDGVDLDDAARSIAGALVTNQGQICSVGSRLIIERSIEAEFVERLKAHVAQIRAGDPLDPATTFGPLVSERQRDRVMGHIEAAPGEGAQLVTGGHRLLPETNGFYVEPTIFRAVDPTSRLAQEEVFGPVLAVFAFDTEDEAIAIANGTAYGLAAYAWTTELNRAMRIANGINSSVRVSSVAPIGEAAGHAGSSEPAGQSGVGIESGLPGMESYMRRQGITITHG